MLPEKSRNVQNGESTDNGAKDPDVVEIAEVWAYLGVLVQVSLPPSPHTIIRPSPAQN